MSSSSAESNGEKPGGTPESAIPVRQVSAFVGDWIARLGTVWAEGQLAEVSIRPGMSFLKLRDVDTDNTISIHVTSDVLKQVQPPVEQGSRVIVQLKAEWWGKRGQLSFKVLQLRAVGLGELMARLEALRNLLASEGLFNPDRKKALPFLPRRIGLICGRNSDAMHDVIENAKRRWPDVEFVVREVPVQGNGAVRAVSDALTELDAIDDVDVIVVARGGGAFEDLLPFSDESLIRVAASVDTPIVSAIGHEEDKPLFDLVADFRASTPTDAARNIVPDIETELRWLSDSRSRNRQVVTQRITLLTQQLDAVRNRPALANPTELIDVRIADNERARQYIFNVVDNRINLERARLQGQAATLRALSPQGTLDRGYAIVRDAQGHVIRDAKSVASGQEISIKVASGDIAATTN